MYGFIPFDFATLDIHVAKMCKIFMDFHDLYFDIFICNIHKKQLKTNNTILNLAICDHSIEMDMHQMNHLYFFLYGKFHQNGEILLF